MEYTWEWFLNVFIFSFTTFFLGMLVNHLSKIAKIFKERKKNEILLGLWKATFTTKIDNKYHDFLEIIELKNSENFLLGTIKPDKRNHERLKLVENDHPKRVKGIFNENRFFTGTWFHPIKKNHFHGSFQLELINDKLLKGIWIGYGESQNKMDQGEWVWERI